MNDLAQRLDLAVTAYKERTGEKMNPRVLAGKSGVPQPTVHRIMSGESKSPDMHNVMAICQAIEADFMYIAFGMETVGGSEEMAGMTLNAKVPVLTDVDMDAIIGGEFKIGTQPLVSKALTASIDAFAFEHSGESMSSISGKSYPSGTTLLVDPKQAPQASNSDLALVKINSSGAIVFRQLGIEGGQEILKPLNQAYPIISEDFTPIGKVIGGVIKS